MSEKKTGRPEKKIDKDQFEKLCGLQCTIDEFCCFFDCDDKTLSKWCQKTYNMRFSEVFNIKRGNGKISLRRKQFEVALSGNPSMLIFLGKNYLAQTDRQEVSNSIDIEDLQPLAEMLKHDENTDDTVETVLEEA